MLRTGTFHPVPDPQPEDLPTFLMPDTGNDFDLSGSRFPVVDLLTVGICIFRNGYAGAN